MRVYLEMPEDAGPRLRARLDYAFRLFCAIYGHQPVVGQAPAEAADVTLRYRGPFSAPPAAHERIVWLSRGYHARQPRQPAAPPIRYSRGSVNTVVHAAPTGEDAPDWLGEIFEWVSCADEYSVTGRDSVGRPLFASTYAGRHRLDTMVPYAAIAMQLLQREICRVVPRALPQPRVPTGAAGHVVVPTHDVDYFPVGRLHAANRLGRNAVISFALYKQPALGVRQAGMAAAAALGRGPDPLHGIAGLMEGERQRGIRATYNFLTRHAHRRDARYTLESAGVAKTMRWLEQEGMEVGIQTSYKCHDDPGGLKRELSHFHAQGFFPRGGRQHWLRFTLDRLIPVVERAGLAYDCSIGWSKAVGFRAGACFSFPPYNFAEERAAAFLEIPLVMMEEAFLIQRLGPQEIFEQAASLLAESRRFGWGGVSLLWHPAAFGEGWLPPVVGDTFWRLADQRAAWGDEWMSAQDFVAAVRKRYVAAGLLPAVEPLPPQERVVAEWAGAWAGTRVSGLRERDAESVPVALAQDNYKKA